MIRLRLNKVETQQLKEDGYLIKNGYIFVDDGWIYVGKVIEDEEVEIYLDCDLEEDLLENKEEE